MLVIFNGSCVQGSLDLKRKLSKTSLTKGKKVYEALMIPLSTSRQLAVSAHLPPLALLVISNSFLSGLPVPFAPSLDSFIDSKACPASESLVFALLDKINVF